jgi:predicted PurR-regulated permease PerM
MTSKIVLAYMIYLPLVLGLTLYVARTLFTNGRTFMLDIFKGKEDIANATNKLFEVGFYLLNMGFALLILKIDQGQRFEYDAALGEQVTTYTRLLDTNQEMVEALASKVGGFAIYLGVMLFLNLYMFFRGRKKARQSMMQEPVHVPVVVGPTR